MSALKRSSTCRKSYAGSAGEVDLVKSLELLFYISGKTYQKQFPDFTIPSAYEFLGYARSVSDEVYDKSRKTLAIAQFHNGANKSTIQKILHSRPFVSTKHPVPKHLLGFLQFIHNSCMISNNVLLCISTVYYAVTLYSFLQNYMEPDVYYVLDSAPITQFCTSHMPVLYHIRHSVRDHIARFFQDSAESLERHMSGCKFECDALTGALAAVILTGIETHIIRNPGYKKQVLDPLLRVMRIAGIQM